MLFLVYGLLAWLAFWACLRDRDLFWIGLWLLGGWGISNLLDWYAPASVAPGPYTLIEIMVLTAAYCAWVEHRPRYVWPLIAIAICNTASIVANVAFAMNYPPTGRQIYLWEWTTNMTFGAECLLAFGVGVADRVRTGRLARWPRLRRDRAEPDAARREQGR